MIDKEKLTDSPPMPSLEVDEEEVREGKEIKHLTPNKLLTRVPILLVQIKDGNNSDRLKITIFLLILYKKYYIFGISIIKSLKQFTAI